MSVVIVTEPNEWSAVYNEVLVELQRKDFLVSAINGINLTLSGAGSPGLAVDDYIYLFGDDGGGGTDEGFFTIATRSSDTVFTINTAFSLVATSGFMNSDDVRDNWYVALLVEDEVYLKITPDATGLCSADISENLIYLLTPDNISDYGTKYIDDENLGKSYQLDHVEIYDETEQAAVTIGTYFCVFAALGYSDMANYVIEPVGTPNTSFVQFLTEFTQLAYWNGQSFDVSILSSFSSATLFVKEELHNLDGSSSTNSYALSDFVNKLNRYQMTGSYSGVDYINLYVFDTTRDRLTEKLRIDIYNECTDAMSVCWINTKGGMDYWNFLSRQDHNLGVAVDSTIFLDDEEFDYSKSAFKTIVLYADDIKIEYVSGLEGLLYSLQAFAEIDGSYEKVRVKDGSFNLYRSDSERWSIQVELIRERLNLGHL